jgi:hypothetical protein
MFIPPFFLPSVFYQGLSSFGGLPFSHPDIPGFNELEGSEVQQISLFTRIHHDFSVGTCQLHVLIFQHFIKNAASLLTEMMCFGIHSPEYHMPDVF